MNSIVVELRYETLTFNKFCVLNVKHIATRCTIFRREK